MERVVNKCFLLISILIVVTCSNINGQNKTINLTKPIPINAKLLRIDSMLKIVSRETGLIFSYDASKIKTTTVIILKKQNPNLVEIFSLLKNQASLDCKLLDDHAVLYHSKTQESLQPRVSSKNTTTKINSPVTNPAIAPTQASPENMKLLKPEAGNRPLSDSSVSIILTDTIQQNDSTQTKSSFSSIDSARANKKKSISSKSNVRRQKRPISFKLTAPDIDAKAGLSIDESSYMGATTQIGVPFLYGTVSWNTNLNVNHWRLGILANFKLSKNLDVQLSWNNGSLEKTYVVDSTGFLPLYNLNVKSKLTRFGISVQFPISPLFIIQVGSQFNILQTEYFINSTPTTLQLLPNAREIYYTIKAPYSFNKELSPQFSYLQNWVGFQLSVLYKIKLYTK
jgi:hypothetical protein